jgi:osmotically-inducible protein OsmY
MIAGITALREGGPFGLDLQNGRPPDLKVTPKVISQDVRGKIIDALKRNAELDANSVMVVVHDDRVTLLGKVKSWRERDVAERAAGSAPGVAVVEDRLDIG